jgi:hypothetical protein
MILGKLDYFTFTTQGRTGITGVCYQHFVADYHHHVGCGTYGLGHFAIGKWLHSVLYG